MQTCMQTFKQTNKKTQLILAEKKPNFKSQNFSLNKKKKKKETLFNPIQDIHFIETKTKVQQKISPSAKKKKKKKTKTKNFPAKDCKQEKNKKRVYPRKCLPKKERLVVSNLKNMKRAKIFFNNLSHFLYITQIGFGTHVRGEEVTCVVTC